MRKRIYQRIKLMFLRRRLLCNVLDRKYASYRCALTGSRVDRHRSAVQLDEGAHKREPETRTAVL
jgi:hypothetical protein